MRGRVDRAARQLHDRVPGEGVDLGDPLHGVAPELDAHGLLVVGRMDLDRVAPHAEGATLEGDVVALVLHGDELFQQRVAPALLADRGGHEQLAVQLGIAQAVDGRHARHDDDVLPLHQARRGPQAQPVDVVVDGGVLGDVGVGLRDVRLGLVVVVVRDEELDGALGEEPLQLAVQLGRERLVVRQHEGGAPEVRHHVRHRHRLPRPRHAQEGLVSLTAGEARGELADGARLVSRRRERGHELERHAGET